MGKGRCELMEWAWSLRLMVDSNKKLRPCCVMRWWIPQGNLGSIRGRGARSSLFLFIVQRWWWCGSPSTVQRALHLWLLPGAIKRAASGGSSVTSLLSSSDIYISHLLVPFPYSRGIWRKISINPLPPRKKKNSSCLPTNYLVYSVSAPIKFKSGCEKKKNWKEKIWNSYEMMR